MRLFVECAFPHLGKRGGTSRKGALWARRLTEKRVLRTSPSRKTAFWGRHLTERRILRTSFSRKSTVWATRLSRSALFRHVAAPGRCGATPPARLRGTMENASTGQMRSSNPPPGCGAGCARVRKSRFRVWSHGKVHSEAHRLGRVHFSVTSPAQSALFRDTLTKKRSLAPAARVCSMLATPYSPKA